MCKLSIVILLLTSILAPAGCAQTFSAGAKKIEITPPPGFPTGGHGPAGDIARGYWNRLYVRAFYIGTGRQGLILVSCDLFAFPLGLNAEIWKRVRDKASSRGLGQESLILAATHTHQGPGNYMTAQVHNEFGSSASGFSKELFEFLARRISAAILGALEDPRSAKLKLYSAQVAGSFENQFVMNRSPNVFMLNWDRKGVLDRLNEDRKLPSSPGQDEEECQELRLKGEPKEGWDLPGCPRLRAVDRRMTILEVWDAESANKIGALIFFAVHPTVLMHSAPIYNSDFIGQAVDSLEAKWTAGQTRETVVGFFNGAEGDITARRVHRDIREVRQRSFQFLEAVDHTLKYPLKDLQPKILVRARLFDSQSPDDQSCALSGATSVALAPKPAFGAAGIGGGELDRTSLYNLGWREGVRRPAQDHQGPKVPALDATVLPDIQLTNLLAPPQHFPRFLPVTYAEIDSFWLGVIPVEMSTTAAVRIRSELTRGEGYFQIIGLANEYGSYTATASEYQAQDYMGASTLWGPQEAEFWQCQLETLQRQDPPKPFQVPDAANKPGPPPRKAGLGWLLLSFVGISKTVPFGPVYVGDRRELPDDGLEEILLNSREVPERHLPFFEWEEQVANSDEEFAATEGRHIEVDYPDGRPFDNGGADFLTMLLEGPNPQEPNTRRWAVIWLRPLWEQLIGEYLFKVTPAKAPPILSKPFPVLLTATGKPEPVPAAGVAPFRRSDSKPRTIPRLRHQRHRF